MRKTFLLLLCILLCSCSIKEPSITAYTEFLSRKNLASFYVGTPDPQESYPSVGQRLRVKWALPKYYFKNDPNIIIRIGIRFYNKDEILKELIITHPIGVYEYVILNEEYFCKNGILAFYVDMLMQGEVICTWKHQLWVEKINFTKDENDIQLIDNDDS